MSDRLLRVLTRVGQAVKADKDSGKFLLAGNYVPTVKQNFGRHQYYRVETQLILPGKANTP